MENAEPTIGMSPPHPGEFVRAELIDELGLSISAAARVLGVRRATLSDFLRARSGLSPELALRIEKAFGLSLETMLRMQAWYDAHNIRKSSDNIQVEPYRAA